MTAVLEQLAVDVAELVALFAGDDLTDGYPTVGLAEEICRRAQPATAGALKRLVFGDWPPDEVPLHARCALAVGYADWARFERDR